CATKTSAAGPPSSWKGSTRCERSGEGRRVRGGADDRERRSVHGAATVRRNDREPQRVRSRRQHAGGKRDGESRSTVRGLVKRRGDIRPLERDQRWHAEPPLINHDE